MTFRTYENEYICLYEDPVWPVQASGIRPPEGPINNHSPTRDCGAAQSASLVD